MSIAALIRRMADAGASSEAIAIAVEAIEAEQSKIADRRAQAAARKARQRERQRDSHATVAGHDRDKVSPLCPPDKDTPIPPEINPPISPHPDNTANARADDVSARIGELYAALGVTDETKLPGLLAFSEPIRWVTAGCDIDADILPTLRVMAMRRKPVRAWAYCSEAVFEARNRRLAPAPAVQPQATAPPSKPRTVSELAIHRLKTGDFNREHVSTPDRCLGEGDGSGQTQGPGVLGLVAIAANGYGRS